MNSHILGRQTQVNSKLDEHLEELRLVGYTVLHNVFEKAEVDMMSQKIDLIYNKQIEELEGELALCDINDEFNVRMPMYYDSYFVDLIKNDHIINLLEGFLGQYFILYSQNCNINMPGDDFAHSRWHTDVPYQEFNATRPLGLTSIVCLDDFNAENGGTLIIPCSHRMECLPSDKYVEKFAVPIEASAGSVIAFDTMLYHMSGINHSNQGRKGIVQIYSIGNLRQQYDTATFFKGKYKDDKLLEMLLGYGVYAPSSVVEWRKSRISRIK